MRDEGVSEQLRVDFGGHIRDEGVSEQLRMDLGGHVRDKGLVSNCGWTSVAT